MDPSDGKMEDDLYGLLGCVHGDTAVKIKKNGKLARLRYHPDKAERALKKEGVEITQDVQARVNTRFRYINQAITIFTNAKLRPSWGWHVRRYLGRR
eukprot:900300-Karenia_brevis.AAC.1